MRLIPGIRSRLVYKLILGILLFRGCMTLLLTGVQLYIEYRRDAGEIHHQFARIESSFLASLSSAVWRLNDDLIQTQLEGMRRLRDIRFVEIVAHGKRVAAMGAANEEEALSEPIP